MSESLIKSVETICDEIKQRFDKDKRMIVIIAGPPASGKSTVSEAVVERLNSDDFAKTKLLPMDGYHLDNSILEERGHLARKGAPHTFDAVGFIHLLKRVIAQDEDVIYPTFDRSIEKAVAGSGIVTQDSQIIVVEGNYLLLNSEPWLNIKDMADLTVFISPPLPVLEQRLLERWKSFGFDDEAAKTKAFGNDIPNAKLVVEDSMDADISIENAS